MVEIRDTTIRIGDQEPQAVKIIDNGENFRNGEGRIPNHDKIEIIYISPKA